MRDMQDVSMILPLQTPSTVHSSGPAAERFPHLLGRYDRVYCSDEGTPVYRRSAARVDRPENNTHFYYVYYSGMFLNIITILSLIHQNNLAPGWWVATLLELEAGSRVLTPFRCLAGGILTGPHGSGTTL